MSHSEKLSTEIRKEQIAQAALEVVTAQGVAGLSVATVAGKLGLAPSALYRHFPGKDQILQATIELIGQRLTANVATADAQSGPALQRLRLLLQRQSELIRRHQGILRIVFSEAIYGQDADRREKIGAIMREVLQAVAGLVRQGQQAGEIRGDVEPEAMAVMFLGLIQMPAILWHVSGGKFALSRQIERGWTMFERAVAAEPGQGRDGATRSGAEAEGDSGPATSARPNPNFRGAWACPGGVRNCPWAGTRKVQSCPLLRVRAGKERRKMTQRCPWMASCTVAKNPRSDPGMHASGARGSQPASGEHAP